MSAPGGRPRGVHTQAIRCVRLAVRVLRGEQCPASEWAREYGVSQRTIHRDLRALVVAGVDVETGD